MRIAATITPDIKARQSRSLSSIRDKLEESPITATSGVVYQFADRDEKRMRDALNQWSSVTQMKTATGKLRWKADDNSIHEFTQTELQLLFDELLAKRTARADSLFAYSEIHKAQLPLDDNHACFIEANWPTA